MCYVDKVKFIPQTTLPTLSLTVTITYQDGTSSNIFNRTGAFSGQPCEASNPSPSKIVSYITYFGGSSYTGPSTIRVYSATFSTVGNSMSFSSLIDQPISADQVIVYLNSGLLANNPNVQASYTLVSGAAEYGPYKFEQTASLPGNISIEKIKVKFIGVFTISNANVSRLLIRRIK